ncbi:MAG: T9SS type A sorting domain-containing protein [bacterium]
MKKIVLIVILVLVLSAQAQWSSDPSANTFLAYYISNYQVTSDNRGGAVVGWEDFNTGRIYLQRLDRYGYKLWGENGIPVAVNMQQAADFGLCATDPDHFVIIYPNIQPSGDCLRLMAQKLDTLGNRLWGDDGIPVKTQVDTVIGAVRVLPDGFGGVYFTWLDERVAPYQRQFFIQHLDADGNCTWAENGIPLSSEDDHIQGFANMTASYPGLVMTFWIIESSPGWAFTGQLLNLVGNKLWGESGWILPVYYGGSAQISDQQGGTIITGNTNLATYSQRVDTSASFLWSGNGVQLCETSVSPSLKMALGPNLSTYYLWYNESYSVYLQRVTTEGMKLFGPDGINVSYGGFNMWPAVINADGINVIGTWQETQNDRIIAQKFDSTGSNLWDSDGVVVTTNTYFASTAWMISDMNGGAIIFWTMPLGQLYAQQVSANGNLGEILAVLENPQSIMPRQITLLPAYPNPFNPTSTIRYALPEAGKVTLAVYDISGRLVATLADGVRTAGIHEATFDAAHLSSGVYVYRLSVADYSAAGKLVLMK